MRGLIIMSKIFVKSSSGIMGGSDTRIYNPRSESSHMYRNNHEDDTYGPEDARVRDENLGASRITKVSGDRRAR